MFPYRIERALDDFFGSCFGFLVVILLAAIVLFGGIVAIVTYTTFSMDRAEIEQFRINYTATPIEMRHVLYDSAIEVNTNIVSQQKANTIPIIKWTVPNGWDKIPLIDLNATSK